MRISQWSKVDTKWYLGVRCHKCETPILFALDRSGGAVEPGPTGKLVLTCSLADAAITAITVRPLHYAFKSSRPC